MKIAVLLCWALLVGWVVLLASPPLLLAEDPQPRMVRWDPAPGATFYRLYQEQCRSYWFWKTCSWVKVGEELQPTFQVLPPKGQSRWMAANVFSSDREVRNAHFGWWIEY